MIAFIVKGSARERYGRRVTFYGNLIAFALSLIPIRA